MKTTREEIIRTSLRLFAERGYDAVSTGMIAGELGITKGALYRHFTDKQEIFDSIIRRMFELDAQRAGEEHVPAQTYEQDAASYEQTQLNDLCSFTLGQFDFWTEDPFASLFRRMITLEQFKSPEKNKLYQDVIALGPVRYTADLMREMISSGKLNDQAAGYGAWNLAAELFAPLQLMIQLADGGEDHDQLKEHLREMTSSFARRWCAKDGQQGGNHMSKTIIRLEREDERREVEELVRSSFWNVYRPGCTEHYVLKMLRDDPAFVRELDLVMELDGRIIGQIIFMKARITGTDGQTWPILTMGPICISNELKRKGYGKQLLDESFARAAKLGYGAVCFEGNIDFYGKSGCVPAATMGLHYHGVPDEEAGFFLCKELIPGALEGVDGEYQTPEGYFAADQAPEAFEAYDATFPQMEKLKLPGQLFS